MPVPVIGARPDRLGALRVTCGGIAEGLAERAGELDRWVHRYRASTEPAFELECAVAGQLVDAFGLAVGALGRWVGQVADAFAEAGGFAGLRFLPSAIYFEALPLHLRVGVATDPWAGVPELGGSSAGVAGPGLTLATALLSHAHPRQLELVAALVGPQRPVGAWLARGAASPAAADGARYVAGLGALTVGVAEARHRWGAEPDRPWLERAARAGFDGAVMGGATMAGGMGGQALGTALCTPAMSPVAAAAVCGPVAAAVASELLRNLGEDVTDHILGDEDAPWVHDPDELAAQVGDVD
jgi:hypothetical protein